MPKLSVVKGTLKASTHRQTDPLTRSLYRICVPLNAEEEMYFKSGARLMDTSLCDMIRKLLVVALEPYRSDIEASVAATKAFRESVQRKIKR